MDFIEKFLLFGGLTLLIVGGLFTLTMLLSTKRADIEKTKTPIFSERCGGQFGLLKLSVPFVRLTLYDNFLVISHWKKIILPYNKIKRLEDIGFIGIGLEIVTKDIDNYGRLIIRTFNKKHISTLITDRLNAS